MHPTAGQHLLQLKDDQQDKRRYILEVSSYAWLLEGFDVVFLPFRFLLFTILGSKANVHDRSHQVC